MKAIKAARQRIGSAKQYRALTEAVWNTLWLRANAYDQSHRTTRQRRRQAKP